MDGWVLVALVGVVWALGYVAACVWWPFVSCPARKCQGGKVRSPSGRAWRRHWWCGGRGSRVRWGRRLVDLFTGRRTS